MYVGLADETDEVISEEPLPFDVPLPEECTITGTRSSRSYNQGQCSRKPCQTKSGPCSESWKCCYKVGQTSKVSFSCSGSKTVLQGSTIVSCWCELCDKLQAEIQGRVLSSVDHKPVVLVAIMIADEIATFTDQSGRFYFQLTTNNRRVTLSFQEARHRQVEVTVDIQHDSSPDLVVVMEKIQTVKKIDRLQDGISVKINDQDMVRDYGVNMSLTVTPNSLITANTFNTYLGSGCVLHSLYHTGVKPEFTSKGLREMIYRDSKGAEFTIQSFLIGSLEIVDDVGHPLTLKQGRVVTLSIAMKFEGFVKKELASKIHLFAFSDLESRWLDFGKLIIISMSSNSDKIETWVTFKGKLRIFGSLWAIGLPVRVSCCVKTRVYQSETGQELLSQSVTVEQSDFSLKRPTYYRYSTTTSAGVGACLKAVCALGGLISLDDNIIGADYTVSEVTPPDVNTGVVMGNGDQIMFYLSDKSQIGVDGETPYYLTAEVCTRSSQVDTGFFVFTRNLSVPNSIASPSLLPPVHQLKVLGDSGVQREYCFVKVAIYDCAPYSDVKTLSYDAKDHSVLISMHADIATPLSIEERRLATTGHSCESDHVTPMRASCVEYTCKSDVHVSVSSRQNTYGAAAAAVSTEPKTCRYWSSNSNVPRSLHPSSNMKVFHFVDKSENYDSGLYRSSGSRDLALMQCKAGSFEEPSNVVDPYQGAAVTFTCQY